MKFIFGREITDPADFYDREEELNTLINSFRNLQPVAVIGYRRLGKSSLLNVALRLVGDDFIAVKVSLEGIRTIRQFLDLYAGSVLAEVVRRSLRLRVRPILANVRDYLHELLGAVREVGIRVGSLELYARLYSDALDGRVNAIEALREFLDMPQRLAEDLGRRIIVVLDEFQQVRFLKQPYPEILRVMRSRWQVHDMVEYAIAGSEVGIIRELLGRGDEPFYAFFRVMELKPFSKEVGVAFLRDGLREYGRSCPEEVLERAYELTVDSQHGSA
ncbi:ATP-binding protein [Vulcanisaeta sp. JCM 16161]|uniref:AAA family ATPase n=1 Tax=Vulcanisaeta sp. JCM 16161 TaxID=1295372 RepID=UPI0006D0FCA1|nr:ATP-binding protein [Vulcanisaeta sp. JCM 16161]